MDSVLSLLLLEWQAFRGREGRAGPQACSSGSRVEGHSLPHHLPLEEKEEGPAGLLLAVIVPRWRLSDPVSLRHTLSAASAFLGCVAARPHLPRPSIQ